MEVKVLEAFGREAVVRKRWVRMWDRLDERILCLPVWMQDIVLDDVNTAVKNRLAIMEMIQNANRNHRR